jgi:hypothetical protein
MRLNIIFGLTALCLLINGAGAMYGGGLLVLDPSGSELGLPLSWLEETPFRDFFLPGLVLLLVNGVCSLYVLGALVFHAHRAAKLVVVQGLLLSGWIGIQVLMVQRYHPLQVIMGAIGLALLLLGWQLQSYRMNEHRA